MSNAITFFLFFEISYPANKGAVVRGGITLLETFTDDLYVTPLSSTLCCACLVAENCEA